MSNGLIPMAPVKFLCYELHLRNGACIAVDRTKARLREHQRRLKERGVYSEIHKKDTRGYTFVG